MVYKAAKVIVCGAKAWAVDLNTITKGMTGAVVEFDYQDPMWEGLKKCVVFEGYDEPVGDLRQGNTVKLPWEVTAQVGSMIKVGVYGEDAAGQTVIPTIWAELGTVKSAPSGGFFPPGAPTPTPWAQIMAMIGDLAGLSTKAKDNLVAAINEVLDKVGTGGAVSDEQIAQAVADYLAENPVDAGVQFETDASLTLKDGVLSVNTTDQMEQDNTLPITSAGVFTTVGNIEALLATI